MSSIIDALKKSDQSRNNEHRADINNIKFGDTPPKKSRKGFWLLVIVLLLTAAGVYAWQQGWHQNVLSFFTKDETTALDKAADIKKPQQVATNTNKAIDPAQPRKQNVNQLTPPKQSDIKAKTEQVRKEKSNRLARVEEMKPVANNTQNDPPKVIGQEQNNSKPSLAQNNFKKETKNQNKSAAKDPIATVNANDQNTKPKNILEPTLTQDYLLIHQIDYAIRKNIPSIKLNIHIYDPEPENRMVLINGERYNIGDSIEDVLMVDDIVKEGIVVSFEGLKFLIPK